LSDVGPPSIIAGLADREIAVLRGGGDPARSGGAGRVGSRGRGVSPRARRPAAGRERGDVERVPDFVALAILSSDVLSPVAYGPEAMLAVPPAAAPWGLQPALASAD
jgi:hypothetical protein